MLNILAFPVAVVLGFLAGLGVGGGSLLMVWLTMVVGMDHNEARTINLLFFLPSAFIASLFRQHQGTLCVQKILPAAIFGCITAVLFSLVGRQISSDRFEKLFGALLIFTGIRELFYRPQK